MSGAMKYLALLLLCSLPLSAGKKYAPLPPAITAAHIVYLVNRSDSRAMDTAYNELTKWGRFKITSDPDKADLFIVLDQQWKDEREDLPPLAPDVVTTTGSATTVGNTTFGSAVTTVNRAQPIPWTVRHGVSYVSVFDSNKNRLWVFSAQWRTGPALKSCFADFKKRLLSQEQ